jgi:hypothetical protein
MSSGNRDNRLKQDVYGNKEWRPVRFHEGKDALGRVKTSEGFKNVLTDQEVSGSEPPYATGEALGMKVSEAYRKGYEEINWHTGPQNQS